VSLVVNALSRSRGPSSCLTELPPVMLLAMPSTLVECVPNFSEGRDPSKVDAIVEAMKIPGVYLLDREMDSDHNRCVITLAG
jgi:Formiminotransferase domain, N-terminal subdomain